MLYTYFHDSYQALGKKDSALIFYKQSVDVPNFGSHVYYDSLFSIVGNDNYSNVFLPSNDTLFRNFKYFNEVNSEEVRAYDFLCDYIKSNKYKKKNGSVIILLAILFVCIAIIIIVLYIKKYKAEYKLLEHEKALVDSINMRRNSLIKFLDSQNEDIKYQLKAIWKDSSAVVNYIDSNYYNLATKLDIIYHISITEILFCVLLLNNFTHNKWLNDYTNLRKQWVQ